MSAASWGVAVPTRRANGVLLRVLQLAAIVVGPAVGGTTGGVAAAAIAAIVGCRTVAHRRLRIEERTRGWATPVTPEPLLRDGAR